MLLTVSDKRAFKFFSVHSRRLKYGEKMYWKIKHYACLRENSNRMEQAPPGFLQNGES